MFKEIEKKLYQMDCDEHGNVMACFVETNTEIFKNEICLGKHTHRDVISLGDMKSIISQKIDRVVD